MGFDVVADAYLAFMGRYSEPLAGLFLKAAGVRAGQTALDVGCGPGALTARLAEVLGPERVLAVDPSEAFVGAARERCPGVDVRRGVAEELPFGDGSVDIALAQLVVHFMADPVAGLREMGRVSRGVVAATVWDHGGGTGPLSVFWAAVRDLDPANPGEGERAGTREGQLAELFRAAGLTGVESGVLTVAVPYETFEQWWHPYTLGVGPAGDHVAGLDDQQREALRERCRERLPEPPFEIRALAWFARGRAGESSTP
ncbi:MAG TPA: methyltransferase domain-containing protein [Mycobacteriales bacterium]